MPSRPWRAACRWLDAAVTAVLTQREAGGNLAEASTTSSVMRDRPR
jgi:hypothetical protein